MSNHMFSTVEPSPSDESIATKYDGITIDASNPTQYKSKAKGPRGLPVCELPIANTTEDGGGVVGQPRGYGFVPGKNFTFIPDQGFVETNTTIFDKAVLATSTPQAKAPAKGKGKAKHETMVDVPEKVYTKVSLQGTFGKFTGKYIDVVQEEQLLVLIQDADEDGFVPPVSEDTSLKLSWINQDGDPSVYEVFFLGLQYTSKTLGITSFIFHIAAE